LPEAAKRCAAKTEQHKGANYNPVAEVLCVCRQAKRGWGEHNWYNP